MRVTSVQCHRHTFKRYRNNFVPSRTRPPPRLFYYKGITRTFTNLCYRCKYTIATRLNPFSKKINEIERMPILNARKGLRIAGAFHASYVYMEARTTNHFSTKFTRRARSSDENSMLRQELSFETGAGYACSVPCVQFPNTYGCLRARWEWFSMPRFSSHIELHAVVKTIVYSFNRITR